MGYSALSTVKAILLIGYSTEYSNQLITFLKQIVPATTVEVYDVDKGCPDSAFEWANYDLVIMAYDLGNDENGLEWIRSCSASNDFPAVIMITGKGSESLIVQAFRYGVQDFLRKDEENKILLAESIERVLGQHKQEQVKADTVTLSSHIYNKSRFLKKVEQAKKNDVVIVIELDGYQSVHDEYGIIITDKICSYIARATAHLMKQMKCQGVVIRSGDAAAAALIKGWVDISIGQKFAAELCELLKNNPYQDEQRTYNYTVSVGVAIIDTDDFDAQTVFISADVACRIARNNGGNSFVVYGDAPEQEIDNNSIKVQLENAFIKNRVQPFFQHIVKISDAEMLPFKESLYTTRVNLLGQNNSVFTANEYMPVLQETNKLNTLDRWVIRFCISKLLEEYKKESMDIGLFFTLTSSSYSDKSLYNWFKKLIDESNYQGIGYSLVVEFDIKKFMTYQSDAEILINQLRNDFGISAALLHVPDAGSLEQCMKHVHFEYTRFSPAFDEEIMTTKEIKEIVQIAHEHKSLVIADKLETAESLASVVDAGVDYVSGYITQPPQEEIASAETVEI